MTKEKVNTTNKIIIPKWGKDSLSDEVRKKLIEDLQKISSEELEAMGNKLEEERNRFDEQIWESINIWWKPAFRAKKDGKRFIIRGKEKYSDDFDWVSEPVEIWWEPAFIAKKGEKRFIMRGKEKYSDDFDYIENIEGIWWKPAFRAKKDAERYEIWY